MKKYGLEARLPQTVDLIGNVIVKGISRDHSKAPYLGHVLVHHETIPKRRVQITGLGQIIVHHKTFPKRYIQMFDLRHVIVLHETILKHGVSF